MTEETDTDNGWNDLLNNDFEEMPFTHEREDDLGWHYKDDGYGGYLVVAETEAHIRNRDIKLGIAVEFVEVGYIRGAEGEFSAQAHAAVHPDCLSEEAKRSVRSGGAGDADLTYYDVARYGYRAPIDDQPCDEWEDGYEEVVGGMALADMGVGFILDRRYNRMGNTGWDILREATEPEFDSTEKALERHEEREVEA